MSALSWREEKVLLELLKVAVGSREPLLWSWPHWGGSIPCQKRESLSHEDGKLIP